MQPIPGSAEFPNDNPLLHQGAVWICTKVRGSPRAVLRLSPEPVAPEPVAPEPVAPEPVAPEPVAPELVAPEPELVALVPEPEPAAAPVPVLVAALAPESPPVPVFVCEPVPLPEATPAAPPALEAAPVHELVCEPELSSPPEPPASKPEPPAAEDPFAEYVQAVVEVVLESGSTRAAAALPGLLSGASAGLDDFDRGAIDRLIAQGLAEQGTAGIVTSANFRTTVGVWQRVLRGEPADLSECGGAMLDQWTADFVATLVGTPASRSDDLRRQLRRKGVAAFGMLARAA